MMNGWQFTTCSDSWLQRECLIAHSMMFEPPFISPEDEEYSGWPPTAFVALQWLQNILRRIPLTSQLHPHRDKDEDKDNQRQLRDIERRIRSRVLLQLCKFSLAPYHASLPSSSGGEGAQTRVQTSAWRCSIIVLQLLQRWGLGYVPIGAAAVENMKEEDMDEVLYEHAKGISPAKAETNVEDVGQDEDTDRVPISRLLVYYKSTALIAAHWGDDKAEAVCCSISTNDKQREDAVRQLIEWMDEDENKEKEKEKEREMEKDKKGQPHDARDTTHAALRTIFDLLCIWCDLFDDTGRMNHDPEAAAKQQQPKLHVCWFALFAACVEHRQLRLLIKIRKKCRPFCLLTIEVRDFTSHNALCAFNHKCRDE